MAAHPEDVRWKYIMPDTINGVVQKKNGVEIYYITKFSFQGGSPTLSSPIMFRLAEMYLNKAEAEAKVGDGLLASEARGQDLTLDTPMPEPAGHHHARGAGQPARDVLERERLRVDPADADVVVVGPARVAERLGHREVGVG